MTWMITRDWTKNLEQTEKPETRLALRRSIRRLVMVFLFVQILNFGIDSYSVYDRANLRAAQAGDERKLTARARIGKCVVQAYVEDRPLTEPEKTLIKRLWADAEFNHLDQSALIQK